MIDRDYIIKRLTAGTTTIGEFNYDKLMAPPILSMFSQQDIYNLNYIITNPKYGSKLREKYKLIDDIMKARGFEKFVAGTNRVSYKPIFSEDFIVKIPYCKVALEDNIREYQNQFLIKPFCTKVFEVTPCGTLGVFERVKPITHNEEYLSVADDIYTLLSEYLIGEYVIDDIGTEYFMNIGVRRGFGPVLLDFPYVYKADPTKLFCWAKNANDPTGYCNGAITYDPGFNYLYCTKCGTRYKPFEVGQKIEYQQKIIQKENTNMKITLTGGSRNFKNQETITGEFRNPVASIKSNLINKKVEREFKARSLAKPQHEEDEAVVKTVNGAQAPKEVVEEPKKEEEVKEENPKEEEPVVEEKEEVVPENVKKPFSFDSGTKGTTEDPGYKSEKEDEEEKGVEYYLEKIVDLYYKDEATVEQKEEIAFAISQYLIDMLVDNIPIALKFFSTIINKKQTSIKDEVVNDNFLSKVTCMFKNQILKLLMKSGIYRIESLYLSSGYSDEYEDLEIEVENRIIKDNDKGQPMVVVSMDESSLVYTDELKPIGEDEDDKEEDTKKIIDDEKINENEVPDGIDYYSIEPINQTSLFPNKDSMEIFVLKDKKGNILSNKNNRIAVASKVGKHNVEDIKFVTINWYDNAVKLLSQKVAPVGSLPDEEEEETSEE